MSKKQSQLTAIDFFCGSGGFSEGLRQQGIKVVMGLDNWAPAVNTHNLNHGLNDVPMDITKFWGESSGDVKDIDSLPNTDIIVGSPPCVSFSMSNKAGKADKSLGIHLIKTYLRVIAVKRHQENSILKAWLLENVPNSQKYIEDSYTFDDLNLSEWATNNGLKPNQIALKKYGMIMNSFDYDAPQSRNRYVCGEVVAKSAFPEPRKIVSRKTLGHIKSRTPSPYIEGSGTFTDPNYPSLELTSAELTDHFYDSGLYVSEWEKARDLKLYHPFMGKMSFPENPDKPSRTITATRSGSTRESLVFRSELGLAGNGEYRMPTIREAATLMGYPYSYQFLGGEGVKWKQIGNSVSPQLSFALAGKIREELGLAAVRVEDITFDEQKKLKNPTNLNGQVKDYTAPKRRQKASKFRRVILKESNTTLELLNYHPVKESTPGQSWYLVIFKGTGQGFRQVVLNDRPILQLIAEHSTDKNLYKVASIVNRLKKSNAAILQQLYETDISLQDDTNPIVIVEDLRKELSKLRDYKPVQVHEWHTPELLEGIPFGWRQRAVASHFVYA